MSRRRLDERQLNAIVELAKPNRDTYENIAEKIGVSTVTLWKWRNDDAFNEELKRQVLRNSAGYLPDVMDSVPRHIIEEGNAAMFRTFLQAMGMLTEKVEVENKDGAEADMDEIRAKIERMRSNDEDEG